MSVESRASTLTSALTDTPAIDEKDRRLLYLLLTPIGILIICGYIGQALSPTLAVDAPLLLISLNARNAFLLLAAHEVPIVAFFVVGFLRLVLSDPLFYILGYKFGDVGRAYIDRELGQRGPIAATLRFFDRWFPRIGPFFVFLAPNNIVCLLAGSTRMRPVVFIVANVTGTVARLALFWYISSVFRGPIEDVLDFFNRYQWQLTLAMIALVVLQVALNRRRGEGELEHLRDIAED